MNTKLWLIIPCYNEEEVIKISAFALKEKMYELMKMKRISNDSKVLFVNDGSIDATWEILKELCDEDDLFICINLSHNQGHQNALLAGMMYAINKCDCIISLDADLQDDIDVLPDFLDEYKNGCHVVYGVRNDRSSDSLFKRYTAERFYKFINFCGAETIYNHADYRLMSNKALLALSKYKETNLYLRGLVPLVGMKSSKVFYTRKTRQAGKTKYPLKKMIAFAWDGVTSFSVKPLKLISILGFLCSFCSILGLVYALVSFFIGVTVPGWTAIVCSIWLLGGIQLLCLGMLGEYIGKIFSEVKQRPRYFIDTIYYKDKTRDNNES